MNTPAIAIGTMSEEVPTTDELVASQQRGCQFAMSLLMVGCSPPMRPRPLGNHLVTIVTRASPHLFLNDALDEEALAGSRLCGAAMTVFRCATDPGGIGLTKSGAFNRRLTWAVDELRWPRDPHPERYSFITRV